MAYEPIPSIRQRPIEVAPDTFLIRSAQAAFGAPLSVALNALVIRSAEPVIVDTGTVANREGWFEDVSSIVDPRDVRWIYISHDDDDHVGNLAIALDACPNATLVVTWAMTERLGASFGLPRDRLRWVDDRSGFDVGDRVLRTLRPPVYDSPTTRCLFDPTTRVLWASDAFATPMPAEPVDRVDDLPPPMWAEGMAMFHHHALCPWLSLVDPDRYLAEVGHLRALDATTIVSAHAPVIAGRSVERALDHLAALPHTEPPPHPDQLMLDTLRATS
jgi:flavorubredoxin